MPLNKPLNGLSDDGVVQLAQLGSREACDELVRRFRGAAIMVARQIVRSEQTAEDVAQEALIRAIQGLPKLQDACKFPAWLYAITRHRAQYVSIRDARTVATTDDDLERMRDQEVEDQSSDDPLDTVLLRERQEVVRTVLRDLTPEIQRVIYLFYYEQWTAARIAQFLSLPLTTVKWRLHAGRKQVSGRIHELLEEVHDVGPGCEQRGGQAAPPPVEDGGTGGECRTDRHLRKRPEQLDNAIQYHCSTA